MDERLTCDIVLAVNLGWVERQMVAASTRWVDSSALDSFNELLFVDSEFEHFVDLHLLLLEHGVELFGLSDSSWETIEEKTSLTLWFLHRGFDKPDDNLI